MSSQRMIGRVAIALVVCFAGCSTTGAAQRCLQTPVSSKVQADDVTRCQVALRENTGRRDIFARLVRLLLAQGRYAEVVHWSHQIVAKDQNRTDAIYYLAVGLRKEGRCSDAVPFYRLYALHRPRDPDPHYAIGLCLESMGQSVQARAAYAKYLALEQRPAYERWCVKARATMAALGGPPPIPTEHPTPAAGSVSREATAPRDVATGRAGAVPPPARPATRPTGRPNSRSAAVAAPLAVKSPATATDCRQQRQKVARDPFATGAYEQLALCLRAKGQHQKIVQFMRIALRDNPGWSKGWLHLAQAQKALGRTQSANSALRKACDGGVQEACALR